MAAVQRLPSLIPDDHGRPVDIIDVDLLDDDIVITSRPARRRRLSGTAQSQPDIITVLDSDDETDLQTGNSQPRVEQSSNRRMFSPPPPPQDNAVPPVPAFPLHLQDQQSFPMRRNARPFWSGIVRPNEHPFPFEANIRLGARQADNAQQPPLAAAPPSHHIPAMGLGGALLAMNRPNVTQGGNVPGDGAPVPRPPRSRSSWQLPSFGDVLSRGRFRREHPFNAPDTEMDHEALLAVLTVHADDDHALQRPMFISDQARRLRQFEPDYRPTYTHAGKPLPGFTFDFASPVVESTTSSNSVIVVDDSPGSSTSTSSSSHGGDANTILVCARCMDELVTGDSNTGLEQTRRRIWALRCGHLIDGKCVEEIMKPTASLPVEPIVSIADDVSERGMEPGMSALPSLDKGKGKATDSMLSEIRDPSDLSFGPRCSESNSIRSRLRPRPHSASSYHPPPLDRPLHERPVRPLPYRRQRGKGRGKGKGKAKAPVVEAEHHWNCPVAGCAKVHTSLLIGGKWIMDEKSGAIPVYV